MRSDHPLLNRTWSATRASLMGCGLAEPLLRLGLLGLESTRSQLALHYLKGYRHGMEIGALHFPLQLPTGIEALYIDKNTPEKLRELCSEVAASIVRTDVVADGFTLSCIADASQEFLVANHVLEHSTDALGTLMNWLRVLRPGGTLFVTVPRGSRCFDKGRAITNAEHFLDDYRLTQNGNYSAMRERNRKHIEEHLRISAPAIAREQNTHWSTPNAHDYEYAVERLLNRDSEQIHHHVFSPPSYRTLLDLLTEVSEGQCRIERIARSSIEIIGIVRKLA